MHVTPESKSVLDMLSAGQAVTDGTVSLGPFDSTTQILLGVLIDHYDQLHLSHGEQQAQNLLGFYSSAVKSRMEEASARAGGQEEVRATGRGEKACTTAPIAQTETPPRWKLHELICRSIKGVAPYGEELAFPFDGKSTLLYGPNGSGKTRLCLKTRPGAQTALPGQRYWLGKRRLVAGSVLGQ